MRGVQQLPRYRDPIARNIARLLLRSIQEQHMAPSNTVIEFEARFGQQLGQTNTHRFEFPVSTATAAIIDSFHNHVYKFEAGVTRPVLHGVEQTLSEKGLKVSADTLKPFPRYGNVDAVLLMEEKERLHCATGTLPELQEKARAARSRGASSSSSTAHMLSNPFNLFAGVMIEKLVRKSRVAQLDMCCPDWCADMRFAVSAESTIPVDSSVVFERTPIASRYRSRAAFAVPPFFTVFLTQSITRSDLWWYPSQNPSLRSHSAGKKSFGVGTVIPCTGYSRISDGNTHSRYFTSSGNVFSSGQNDLSLEVEVEINIPAVLREWKKIYGGAAASAYLSAAALVSTTVSGTSMDRFANASSPALGYQGRDDATEAEVRAFALAEREDPFLLRVAEDYLALLQLLAQIRTIE